MSLMVPESPPLPLELLLLELPPLELLLLEPLLLEPPPLDDLAPEEELDDLPPEDELLLDGPTPEDEEPLLLDDAPPEDELPLDGPVPEDEEPLDDAPPEDEEPLDEALPEDDEPPDDAVPPELLADISPPSGVELVCPLSKLPHAGSSNPTPTAHNDGDQVRCSIACVSRFRCMRFSLGVVLRSKA
jgi:hypothetical protein